MTDQYNSKSNRADLHKQSSLRLVSILENNISRDLNYSINEHQIRQYKSYLTLLKQIKNQITLDPRYPHLILQNRIDEIFRKSNGNLKEFIIMFSVNELINKETFNPIVYGK